MWLSFWDRHGENVNQSFKWWGWWRNDSVFIVLQQLRQSAMLLFSLSGDQTGEQRLPTSSRGFSPSHQLQQLLQRLLRCVPICTSRVWVRGIKQAICLMFIMCTMRVYTGTATPHVQNVFVRVVHIVPSTVAVLVKLCVSERKWMFTARPPLLVCRF